MKYYIKNMVCQRCVMAVENIVKELDINYYSITLGEISSEPIVEKKLNELSAKLNAIGFELMDDKKKQLIEKIKSLIISYVHFDPELQKFTMSDYLSRELPYEYNYISNVFSEVEGTTIEKYVITQKIEKVKELIVYDELSLQQIADQLGYSSVAYLSNQFKKVTGLTPSHFKKIRESKRKPLDHL
ncbi:helix-turn-helix domain-containing protein [Flavobacterium sedimenticola]|uniref:AraC family transcriptional regulator n=1 Tax=Flavobacterium sedimenticola TaxID=3043286 RepID=A0ABT6XT64_9FLAO|nr:AraC family transcriptional regulator [Flavobacterium sedimenticola]MDI9258172.1 AraC family transcriptional regulator [Flavobacterium sedimenticola]